MTTEYDQLHNPEQGEVFNETSPAQGPGPGPKKSAPKQEELSDLEIRRQKLNGGNNIQGRSQDSVTKYNVGAVAGENVDETNAYRQSGWEQALNGTLKGAGLAVSTFAHTFTALPYGIVSALGHGATGSSAGEAASQIYDNPVSHQLEKFNQAMESWLPNYYSEEQKKADAFSWANMGNANFIFDKLVKNAGFTVGAIYSGSVVAKGAQALGKIAMSGRIAQEIAAVDNLVAAGMTQAQALQKVASGIRAVDATTRMGGTLVAATTEGSIEALEAKTIAKAELTKLYQERADAAGRDITAEEQEQIDQGATEAGNAVLAANVAILGISDTIQFGKFLGGGWKREILAASKITREGGEFVAKKTGKKLGMAQTAGRIATYPATEAWEEGSQYTAQKGAVDYQTRKFHDPSIGFVDNLIRSTAMGLDETFGTKEGVESMILGALTGIGSRVATGQIVGDFKENGQKYERAQQLAETLNKYKASDVFKNKFDAAVVNDSIQKDMALAVDQGDAYLYKNLEHDAYKNFVQSRIEAGKLDLLMEELNDLRHMSNDEFKAAHGLDKNGSTQKTVDNYVNELQSEAKRLAAQWEDVHVRFPNASKESKVKLWDLMANIKNRDNREDQMALEVYADLNVSLDALKKIDPENYLALYKEQVDKALEDKPQGDAQKAYDLMRLVQDRQNMVRQYKLMLTDKGQLLYDRFVKMAEHSARLRQILGTTKTEEEAPQPEQGPTAEEQEAQRLAEEQRLADEEAARQAQAAAEAAAAAAKTEEEKRKAQEELDRLAKEAADKAAAEKAEREKRAAEEAERLRKEKEAQDKKGQFDQSVYEEQKAKLEAFIEQFRQEGEDMEAAYELMTEELDRVKAETPDDAATIKALEEKIAELGKELGIEEEEKEDTGSIEARFNYSMNDVTQAKDGNFIVTYYPPGFKVVGDDILGPEGLKPVRMKVATLERAGEWIQEKYLAEKEGPSAEELAEQKRKEQEEADRKERERLEEEQRRAAAEAAEAARLAELERQRQEREKGDKEKEGQDTFDEVEDEEGPVITEDDDFPAEFWEPDAEAATMFRTTGNHEKAMDEHNVAELRFQSFIQNARDITHEYKIQAITYQSDPDLYKTMLEQDQRDYHAKADPNFEFKDPKTGVVDPGIILVVVDKNGKYVLADKGGVVRRTVSREELIQEFADGIDKEVGPLGANFAKNVQKVSGFYAISKKHFGRRLLGMSSEQFAGITPAQKERVKQEYYKHLAKHELFRAQLQKAKPGDLVYIPIVARGKGVRNEDAFVEMKLEEFLGVKDINDPNIKFVIPVAEGEKPGKIVFGKAEGLNKETELLTGRPYIIYEGEAYPIQAHKLSKPEIDYILDLFVVHGKRKPADRGNSLNLIKQYLFVSDKSKDPAKRIFIKDDNIIFGENNTVVPLVEAHKSKELREFLATKYRQVNKKSLIDNTLVTPVKSIDTETGRISYGKEEEKISYREWLFNQTKGVTVRGVPDVKKLEGEFSSFNAYLELAEDADVQPGVAPNDINQQPTTPDATDNEAGHATIAADYLLTGGVDTMLSTDFLLQALSGIFTKAASEINTLRNKYAKEISDKGLTDIKKFVGTQTYGFFISEVSGVLNKVYKSSSEAHSIFETILKYPTGLPTKVGNEISIRLDALHAEAPTQQTPLTPAEQVAEQLVQMGKAKNPESALTKVESALWEREANFSQLSAEEQEILAMYDAIVSPKAEPATEWLNDIKPGDIWTFDLKTQFRVTTVTEERIGLSSPMGVIYKTREELAEWGPKRFVRTEAAPVKPEQAPTQPEVKPETPVQEPEVKKTAGGHTRRVVSGGNNKKKPGNKGTKPSNNLNEDFRLEDYRETLIPEDFKKLKKWFEERFNGESFTVVDRMIGGRAMGQYLRSGILLWKGAEIGTGYHEAFHKVTREFLTDRQVQALYSELRKRPGKAKVGNKEIEFSKLNDRQAEEVLAEEFRKYVLSDAKEIFKQAPQRNTIFRKIFNFLRSLFGKKDIQQIFEQIYSPTGFTGKKKLEKGGVRLDRSFEGLTEADTKDIIDSVNYHFFEVLFGSKLTPRQLIQGKGNLDSRIYARVLEQLKYRDENLDLDYPDMSDEEYDRAKELFAYMISNWEAKPGGAKQGFYGSVREAHAEYLASLGINLAADDSVKTEVAGENAEEGTTLQTDDANNKSADEVSRDAFNLTPSNQINPIEFGSSAVRLLLASVPKKSREGSTIYDEVNSMGVPVMADFKTLYNTLLREMAGFSTYEEMYDCLSKLAAKDHTYDTIRKRLGRPSDKLTHDQFLLQRQFRQDFSKFESRGTITLIDPKTGIFYEDDANSNRLVKKIQDRWANNLRALPSPYVVVDEETNVVKVDITKKVNDKTLLELPNVEFLKALGITFSGLSDQDLKDQLGAEMMAFIKKTVKELAAQEKPLNDLYSLEADLKGRMNELAAIEARTTTEVVELSYISAEGKTIYAVTLNNYYSLLVNALNKSKSWEEVIAKFPAMNSVYAQNSLWLDAMYPKNKYGRRGKRNTNVVLRMNTISGMKNHSDVESGVAATKMEVGDKISQDINALLTTGQVSLTRAGDKATEYAFILETAEGQPYRDADNNPTHLPVPLDSVKNTFNYKKVNDIFRGYFYSELGRIRAFNKGLGANIQLYKDAAGDWSIFADIFSDELKEKLKPYKTNTEKIPASLIKEVEKSVHVYMESYSKDVLKMVEDYRIGEWTYESDSLAGVSKNLTHDKDGKEIRTLNEAIRGFVVNHFILTVEQHKLFIGDPAFYKDKFKRISGGTGTKKTAETGKQIDSWLNKNAVRQDGKKANGRVRVNIFNDHKVVSSLIDDYVEAMREFYKKSGRPKSDEQLKAILDAYYNMDEGDAQGWITLDEYREFFNRAGEWSEKAEEQYLYEVAIAKDEQDRTEEEQKVVDKGDPGHVFQSIKAQYFGPQVYQGLNAITFHKYSLMPLFGRNTKGTNMETLLKSMQEKQIGYSLFGSGAKVGALVQEDGKLAPFYNKDGSINGSATAPVQEIYYDYLGIQLDIAPKVKDKVIFGSQFRKLVMSNLFQSKPIDFDGTLEAWEALTEAAKRAASKFYTRAMAFRSVESELVQREFNKLVKELGLKIESDGSFTQVDVEALAGILRESAKGRGMPDNIIDSIQIVEKDGRKELKYPIDSLVTRAKMENMLLALVNSRVIKQKMNGEGMIQGANSGFEEMGIRAVGSSNFLKSYTKNGPEGTTTEMEIMVPASGQYKELADLYGGVDKLNEAIKKPDFDKRLLTMVGYRIPTQGMNSIDVLKIVKFLPESNGSLIILPTEIVAKSGGDFDIDKLNVFRPNFKTYGGKVSYIEYAEPKDPLTAYEVYSGNKKALSEHPVANTIQEIRDAYDKTIARSRAQLQSRINKATALVEAKNEELKDLKLKDVPLSEEEKELLDTYRTRYEADMEELKIDRDMATLNGETLTMEEITYYDTQEQNIKEEYFRVTRQLRAAAKDYLRADVTAERRARIERMRERTREIHMERNAAIGQAILDANIPALELNSTKALQNRILEISMETILDPMNFEILITPNTTDTLTGLTGEVREARGEAAKPPKNSATRELRFDVIMDQYKYFLGGKPGVALGAVHNTSHTLFQLADITLNGFYRTSTGKPKAIKIPFLHNTKLVDVPVYEKDKPVRYEKKPRVFMGGMYDRAGNLISDIISQFINAYVDVAKDPFYKDLNAAMAGAGVYFYLIRAGVDIRTAAYFMTQPIILEYVKQEMINESLVVKTAGLEKKVRITRDEEFDKLESARAEAAVAYDLAKRRGESEEKLRELEIDLARKTQAVDNIYDSVRAKFAAPVYELRNKYTIREFKVDQKGEWLNEEANKRLKKNITMGAQKSDTWTKEFVQDQLYLLDQFLEMRKQANFLSDVMRSVNHDTALLKNFGSVLAKDILEKRVRDTEFITMEKRADIFKKTIVGPFNITDKLKKMYKDMLFTLQEPKYHFDKMIKQINPPSGDFEKVYEILSNDFMGYIFQKHGKTRDGRAIYERINDMFAGETSMAKRLIALKKADPEFARNPLINDLQPVLNENRSSVDNIKLYTRRLTTFESNVLTRGFHELLQSENAEIREFAEDLAIFGVLQSGMHSSPISFTSIIPFDVYGDMMLEALNAAKRDGIDYDEFQNAFYFKNRNNSSIVPYYSAAKEKANEKRFIIQKYIKGHKSKMMLVSPQKDRHWTLFESFRDKHFGYKLQYFGLGADAIVEPTKLSQADEVPDNARVSENYGPGELDIYDIDDYGYDPDDSEDNEDEDPGTEFYPGDKPKGPKPVTGGVGNPVANIPQNLVSGKQDYGTIQEANKEAKEALGANPHSIDMIDAGFRTRTTRSVGEMQKHPLKVGDIIKHFGKSANGRVKNILARVTALHPKGTPGYLNTWAKEGWTMSGIKQIDRFKPGAVAIEFELLEETLDPNRQPPEDRPFTDGERPTLDGKSLGLAPAPRIQTRYPAKIKDISTDLLLRVAGVDENLDDLIEGVSENTIYQTYGKAVAELYRHVYDESVPTGEAQALFGHRDAMKLVNAFAKDEEDTRAELLGQYARHLLQTHARTVDNAQTDLFGFKAPLNSTVHRHAKDQYEELMRIKNKLVSLGLIDISCKI